jgi:hypothetical protein
VMSAIDGTVRYGGVVKGKRKIVIVPDDATVPEHPEYEIQRGVHVNVQEGERVRAGDAPMNGLKKPHDILSVLGEGAAAVPDGRNTGGLPASTPRRLPAWGPRRALGRHGVQVLPARADPGGRAAAADRGRAGTGARDGVFRGAGGSARPAGGSQGITTFACRRGRANAPSANKG